jgi:hypothetical protein
MEGDDNYIISISSSHQLMIFDFLNVELLYPLERQLLVELREKEQSERIRRNNGNDNNGDKIITKQLAEGDQIRRQDLINRKTRTREDPNNNNNNISEVIIHDNTRQDEPMDKRPKSRLKPDQNGSTENSPQKVRPINSNYGSILTYML